LHLVTEGNSGVTPNTLKLRNRYGYLELYNDDANGINIGVSGPYYLQISAGNWNYRCKNDFNHIFQNEGTTILSVGRYNTALTGGDLISSSGTDNILSISPTYNQSGTAGGTDILINRTEMATGSGDQNLMDLQVGGTSKFKVDNAGGVTTTGDANISNSNTGKLTINGTTYGIKRSGTGFGFLINNEHRFVMKTDRSAVSGVYSGSTPHYWGFTNTTHADTASSAVDVRLQREAANHLAMVNGTNAQTFSVAGTYSDSSNYERGVLKWDSSIFKIGTESAGTGSDRIVQFVGAGVSMPNLPTSDPASAGELWNDSGTLKVSAG